MINILIPLHNESENIEKIVNEIQKNIQHKYEIIFCDDGSTDDTWNKITSLKEKSNIRAIKLSKNYGKDGALLCLLHNLNLKNKYSVILDGDLQHPIREITKMLNIMTNEIDIIIGVRSNKNYSTIRKNLSSLFNKFLNFLTNDSPNTYKKGSLSDFTVFRTKTVYEKIKKVKGKFFYRKFLNNLSLNKYYYSYDEKIRESGKSSFNLLRLYFYAIALITYTSLRPLKLSIHLGFLMMFLFTLTLFIALILKLFFGLFITNSAILFMIGLIMISLIISIIGIQSIYLANLYDNFFEENYQISQEFNRLENN